METSNYRLCYEQALTKALSAEASKVRDAYLDLADFYQRKLGGSLASDLSNLDHRSDEKRLAA